MLDAAAALRERQISARELTEECFRVIEAANGGEPSFEGAPDAVNAWARLYPEMAREMAAAADRRLAEEGPAAPLLCGVPIGLKDLFAVDGLPLTASSRVLDGEVATEDCEMWSRLARAGMVLVGHTHTHEFAFGSFTHQVGNPWDLSRSAGGSSGGSAAAIAAGMVPAATGTDTAGSLRIPASMCGISAIKPTYGRLPISGVHPLSDSLDHAGPMARTVADCAALLAVMADGPAEPWPMAPPPPLGQLPIAPREGGKPLAGSTIATIPPPPGVVVAAEVECAFEGAVEACRDLGARIVDPRPPAYAELADFSTIAVSDLVACHAPYAGRIDLYRPFLRQVLEAAGPGAPVQAYLEAQQRRRSLVASWEGWMDEHGIDLLLQPTLVDSAPARTIGYPDSQPESDPWILLTLHWDMTGFPVVALPAGLGSDSGLPVGVSMIARRGGEPDLIQSAIDLQTFELPPPPVPPNKA